MLAKCANPACGAHFRYLHEGRIFNFPFSENGVPGVSRVEHFWLCGKCAASLTVVMNGSSVAVRFRRMSLSAGIQPGESRQKPADAA